MTDEAELFQAALDSLTDGVAIFGGNGEVLFWNQAAQGITGFTSIELLAHTLVDSLDPLWPATAPDHEPNSESANPDGHRAFLHLRHKRGHPLNVVARVSILRDPTGHRIGASTLFHPAESLDALPHIESGEIALEQSRADLEERLQAAFDDYARGGPPFAVIWINVDQAADLRKSHGVGACNSMIEKVRHALAQGLRPSEELGRWDEDEFLIVSQERTANLLLAHAQNLAGLARTADFRWWGDRVSVTVSVGAAQADSPVVESLARLLDRARDAMETGSHTGGNCATLAPRRPICSPL